MTDPADIIGRLRAKRDVQTTLAAGVTFAPSADEILRFEAANLIEAQAREVEQMRCALRPFVFAYEFMNGVPGGVHDENEIDDQGLIKVAHLRAARDALSARSIQGGGDD